LAALAALAFSSGARVRGAAERRGLPRHVHVGRMRDRRQQRSAADAVGLPL